MKTLVRSLRVRPRLMAAAVLGLVVALATPDIASPVARCLLGWNVGVWVYLLWVGYTFWRADSHHLQRFAIRQAESALAALSVVVTGAIVSIGAVIYELSAAKLVGGHHAWPHLVYALVTVLGSWLLVPTLFSFNYASLYFGQTPATGLVFANADPDFEPDHSDFLYFSFTIAVASQTSDVSISTREMRRLVLLQSVLSFLFNTTILAFAVNTAASLF